MNVYDQAHVLARSIRESEEYLTFARLRDVAQEDETNNTLLREYKRLQTRLQLAAVSQSEMDPDEMQRFQQLATLLYMNQDVQAYLMAEMRLQKTLADILKIVSDAGGLDLGFLNA